MASKEHILVVEDERDILEVITYNLKKEEYRVTGVGMAEDAWEVARRDRPDLIVLDIMLPGEDGLQFTRHVKGDPDLRQIPIVMLTARGEEADIVVGLEMGASDYVTKPFSPKVLIARIRAVLRKKLVPALDESAYIEAGELVIHPGRFEIQVAGQEVRVTSTEFRLLHFLARRPGWVFTRQQIMDALHGDAYQVTDRSVDVQIVGLRKKLGPVGEYIETVRGVGYRFRG